MTTRGKTSAATPPAPVKTQSGEVVRDAKTAAPSNGVPSSAPAPAASRGVLADPLGELQARYDMLVREQLQVVQERNQLTRQLAAVPRTERDSAERVAEMEQVLLSIRQARDLLLTRNHQLIADLARADDKIAELGYEQDTAITARDAAYKERDERAAECEELRRGALESEGQMAALVEEGARYSTDLAEAKQSIEDLTKELDEAHALSDERTRQIDELRTQLQERAGKPVARAQSNAQADGGEVRSFRARRDAAILAEQFAAALRERDSARNTAEKNRLAKEQAVTERDKVRAELATVRDTMEKQISALRAQVAATEQAVAPAPATSAPIPARREANPVEIQVPKSSGSTDPSPALDALEECLGLLTEHPDNLNLLDALESHLRTLSDVCHVAGHGAAHRYTVSCRELTRWLHKSPAKVPAVIPTLHQALNLLCSLTNATATGEPAIPDPAGALVYSVDDDADNCECITAALEKATLITKYATKPEIALAELEVIPCELIILDVNMPGMDGFELCAKIREIKHHRTTPILFVSGLMSTQDRLKTIDSEGIEFFPKPYSLAELSVKALGMILGSAVGDHFAE